MENITIHPAALEDYDGVSTLFEQVDRFHAETLPDLFQQSEERARSQEWLAQIGASPDTCMFVAEHQGILVGMVLCTIRSSPTFPLFVPRRYGHINELIVRESFQGQGIGQRLIQHIHEWAQNQRITEKDSAFPQRIELISLHSVITFTVWTTYEIDPYHVQLFLNYIVSEAAKTFGKSHLYCTHQKI